MAINVEPTAWEITKDDRFIGYVRKSFETIFAYDPRDHIIGVFGTVEAAADAVLHHTEKED